MFFEDLNWMDVESYLEQDDRLIFVTGATEQHAYLSLSTDILIPMRLAAAVSHRTNVLVAPPFNFGVSPYFMEYPGTISISQETFGMVLYEIFDGLIQHGFRRFLVLNGHGGNEFPPSVKALNDQVDGLHIRWHNWWTSQVAGQMIIDARQNGGHANWLENFPFNRVAESPSEPKPLLDVQLGESAVGMRDKLGDGSFGGAYQLPDEFMQRFFAALVDEITEIVENL